MAQDSSPSPASPPAPRRRMAFSLYEQVRRRRAKGSSVFMGEGLAISILLHVILLAILASVRFGVPRVDRPTIEIRSDIVEDFKPEPANIRSVISLDQAETIAERGAKLAEKLKGEVEKVPVMGVDALDLGGMSFDLLARKEIAAPTDWQRGNLTGKIERTGEQNYESAMDAIARPIIKTVQKNTLIVPILFDGTKSLEPDRKLLGQQLKRTFDEIKFAIVDKQERNLQWVLIGFGEKQAVIQGTTRDVEKIQNALLTMPFDQSGVENIAAAVEDAIRRFGGEAEHKFVMVLTDEQGDDLGIDGKTTAERRRLKNLVDFCKSRKARVYILGREALFLVSGITLSAEVDGVKGITFRDFGYPTRELEVIRPIEPLALGQNHRSQLSGFGCYPLSLLAHETGGTFYIISDKPSPFRQDLMQLYEPEWTLPEEYDERTRKSLLRRTLRDIREEMKDEFHWAHFRYHGEWSKQRPLWQKHKSRLQGNIQWCDKSIDRLLDLRQLADNEKHARKRWEANYDLTLAQLYKMKYMLMQHLRATDDLLENTPPEPKSEPNQPDTYVIRYWIYPRGNGKVYSGRDEDNARKKAEQALQVVMDKHAGTPWAAQAEYELKSFTPLLITADWENTRPPPVPRFNL